MKQLFSLISVCFIFTVFLMPKTYAHVLQTDETVGAVLHVNPEDDPIVGQPTSFFLEFKDATNRFNPAVCSCSLTIKENDQTIFETPLFVTLDQKNPTSTSISYTFTKKAVYQIIVAGTPTQAHAFTPFTLTYDIRVARESTATPNNNNSLVIYHIINYTIFAVGFIIIIWLILKDNKRNKK